MALISEVTIMLAMPRDAAAIADMSRRYIETGLGWGWRSRRVAQQIAAPDVNVVVARRAGELVGFAIMKYLPEHCHLTLFAVAPQCRRAGVGTALLHWLLETARVAGAENVVLELRCGNREGRAFYESVGFIATEILVDYYRGQESGLRMALALNPPALP